MSDQLPKHTEPEPGKGREILQVLIAICFLAFLGYGLFEAFWVEEVPGCGKTTGCYWYSYQTSPDMFYFFVIMYVFLFVLTFVGLSAYLVTFLNRRSLEK